VSNLAVSSRGETRKRAEDQDWSTNGCDGFDA
jgi:hypothetical protein